MREVLSRLTIQILSSKKPRIRLSNRLGALDPETLRKRLLKVGRGEASLMIEVFGSVPVVFTLSLCSDRSGIVGERSAHIDT